MILTDCSRETHGIQPRRGVGDERSAREHVKSRIYDDQTDTDDTIE